MVENRATKKSKLLTTPEVIKPANAEIFSLKNWLAIDHENGHQSEEIPKAITSQTENDFFQLQAVEIGHTRFEMQHPMAPNLWASLVETTCVLKIVLYGICWKIWGNASVELDTLEQISLRLSHIRIFRRQVEDKSWVQVPSAAMFGFVLPEPSDTLDFRLFRHQ